MADVLSMSLTHAGFQVNKMLPFGTVPEFIPYIVRRAVENRGLLGNTLIDRQSIKYSDFSQPLFSGKSFVLQFLQVPTV
jgi:proline dehydrogenase